MIQAPKGTKDLLPQNSGAWQAVEMLMRRSAALAGFREIRTPVFEHTELFQRGVGDSTDIVQKEMYTFVDKGKRSITLKPEGTAGVVRAVIENKLYADPLPVKVYYLNAPIFRYENPQSGRLREHHQFGMECFGAKEPSADAELITVLLGMLTELGLRNLTVHINSIGCPECRPRYHELLKAYLKANYDELCPTCKERFERNPLRVLDCKEEGCKKIAKDAPVIMNHLCDECAEHFAGLKSLLTAQGTPFKIDTHIVRGLDYYTKTVFEIIMQSEREGLALCGGGRYDSLVTQLDGPALPGVGFGIGTERIMMELLSQGIELPVESVCDVFVANLSADDRPQAFQVVSCLRDKRIKADMDHVGRSLKAQFKYAGKIGARHVVMVGGEEALRGNVKVRDMETREECETPVNDIAAFFTK